MPGHRMKTFLMLARLLSFISLVSLTSAIDIKSLSKNSQLCITQFGLIFPDVDIASVKVYDFIRNMANIGRIVQKNTDSCFSRDARYYQMPPRMKRHVFQTKLKAKRDVYNLLTMPVEGSTHTTYFDDGNPDHYLYIDPKAYDNFTLTNSELAYSKEGWDYSPYVPPGETTTEFIFPSWNYGGKVPEAFYKEFTAGETDMMDVTRVELPDDDLGYTNTDHPKITDFGQFWDNFWDQIFSIPHRCDNYTSIWSCLQGEEIHNPKFIDQDMYD